MRLFFAAKLPEPLQRSLAHLRDRFDWLPIRATWTATENIHITLKFLGEVPEEQVMAISSGLSVESGRPISLRLSGAVLFPPAGAIRVLGIGFQGDTERLVELQGQIETYCQPMGFTRENRKYVPHATLARFRDGLHAKHRVRVEQSISESASLPPFVLTEVQLMQSEISPQGSRYTTIATYPI